MDTEPKKRGNYLSIDGGPTGWVALYTLEEIFNRIQQDLKLDEELVPRRWFDIIIGTGRGAIIALLLGKLGLTISKAIETYTKLEPILSAKPAQNDEEREKNTEEFKRVFLEVLSEAGFNEDAPMRDEEETKTVICVANETDLSVLHLIRSYRIRGTQTPPCTILQAACACVAFPDRFLPVVIGTGHKQMTRVDAVAGYANPTKELLKEAQKIFGEDAEVATIVSIGASRRNVHIATKHGKGVYLEAPRQGAIGAELSHEELQSRLLQTTIYFRFKLKIKLDNRPEAILAHTLAYLEQAETSSRLDEAIRQMQFRPSGTKLRDLNSVTVVGIIFKPRPRLVPNFIGREDILDAMRHAHFNNHQAQRQSPVITILSGVGGSGKTQTALKFALEFEYRYPGAPVYFLEASGQGQLQTDLETLIRSRGIAYREKSYKDALIWLAIELKNWLIILDGADDPKVDLIHHIPRCAHGHVIITSRNATIAALEPENSHALKGLSASDATTLLLTTSRYPNIQENRKAAEKIVRELGHLPLALSHAAGYIFVHRCLMSYLDMYRRNRDRILSSKPSTILHNYNQSSIATTIEMSLGKLSPRARDLVRLFSHLQATSIPHSMIVTAAERRFQRVEWTEASSLNSETLEQAEVLRKIFCPDGEWSEVDFNDLISECFEYSLLRRTKQNNVTFYSMQVLVQSYLLGAGHIYDHQPRRLISRLLGSAVTVGNNYEFLAFNRLLRPHIQLIQIEDVIEAGDHYSLGYVLHEVGDARLALLHRERCVKTWRQLLGEEDEHTIVAMEHLAVSYKEQGNSQAALRVEEAVLSLRQKLLGPESPKTLRCMANLAVSYSNLGENQIALELEETVLSLQKRLLGPKHPDTVRTMGSLAVSYSQVGKNQKALDLQEGVLSFRMTHLGPEHPDTIRTMGNLSISYSQAGKNQAALDLQEHILSLQAKLLGLEHPDTVHTIGNLAVSYRNVGNNQAALELERALRPQNWPNLRPSEPQKGQDFTPKSPPDYVPNALDGDAKYSGAIGTRIPQLIKLLKDQKDWRAPAEHATPSVNHSKLLIQDTSKSSPGNIPFNIMPKSSQTELLQAVQMYSDAAQPITRFGREKLLIESPILNDICTKEKATVIEVDQTTSARRKDFLRAQWGSDALEALNTRPPFLSKLESEPRRRRMGDQEIITYFTTTISHIVARIRFDEQTIRKLLNENLERDVKDALEYEGKRIKSLNKVFDDWGHVFASEAFLGAQQLLVTEARNVNRDTADAIQLYLRRRIMGEGPQPWPSDIGKWPEDQQEAFQNAMKRVSSINISGYDPLGPPDGPLSSSQKWAVIKRSKPIRVVDLLNDDLRAEIIRLSTKPLIGRWIPGSKLRSIICDNFEVYQPALSERDIKDGWFSLGQSLNRSIGLIVREVDGSSTYTQPAPSSRRVWYTSHKTQESWDKPHLDSFYSFDSLSDDFVMLGSCFNTQPKSDPQSSQLKPEIPASFRAIRRDMLVPAKYGDRPRFSTNHGSAWDIVPRDPSNSVNLAMFHISRDLNHLRGNPMTLRLDCIKILNPQREVNSVPYHLQDRERSTEGPLGPEPIQPSHKYRGI